MKRLPAIFLALLVSASGCLNGTLDHGGAANNGGEPAGGVTAGASNGEDPESPMIDQTVDPVGECLTLEPYFERRVWPRVLEQTCMNCHISGGLAQDTRFVLESPALVANHLELNFATLAELAKERVTEEGDESLLLLKSAGAVTHGGGAALRPGDGKYEILQAFVAHIDEPEACVEGSEDVDPYTPPEFFENVAMIDDRRLMRRVALNLVGRLPTAEEDQAAQSGGLDAVLTSMDAMMQEDAFYDRLEEAFSDILLTQGYGGLAERVLSYEHFPARHWTQSWDFSGEPDPAAAETRTVDEYRTGIRQEPLKLITHIVRNDRPFTEFLTADYMVVTPHSARGYGVYDEVVDRFTNPDDPFEYVEAKLPALVDRAGRVQPSETGFYPHAGVLGTFHWQKRYPTTDTNRNRHRALAFYRLFLGVDIMDLAPTVTDAAEVSGQFDNPTMEAPDCVVCHTVLDPVAGIFQDFDPEGVYAPPADGWYTDMFAPGFEGEDLPESEKWRAVQWLAERAIADPRFPVAMAEHAYYVVTTRSPLRAPKDVLDPLYDSRRRAYDMERAMLGGVAAAFVAANYDFRVAIKEVVRSPFYRADAVTEMPADPRRLAELDELGLAHLNTPEQLDRKIRAVFGRRWSNGLASTDGWALLYGGVNSSSVTERLGEPSGAFGALQIMLANEMSCTMTAWDFAHPASERVLFGGVELDTFPGAQPDAEAKIRENIAYLHGRLLGRFDGPDSPAVDRTYQLFADVVADGQAGIAAGTYDAREIYACRGDDPYRLTDDPNYTIRAWRLVIAYLMRQYDFLYE